jgi:two-component system OmpR family response regulator
MNAAHRDMDLQSRILVVDDDADLRSLTAGFLLEHGYRVRAVANVAAMHDALAHEPADLIVLDIMMPGEDGLSAARNLIAASGPPVILLSALGTETDRIIGLEVGADDYLAKPCSPRELLARIRALLRRNRVTTGTTIPSRRYVFAGWHLDVDRRDLRDPGGIRIALSAGEFALLQVLVERPQRVLSRDQLLEFVRGGTADVFDRAIDSQISRLRRKLNDRQAVELIRTVRNEGYMLVPAVARQ